MARIKSVILTPQEVKAKVGSNNAKLKELKGALKAAGKRYDDSHKTYKTERKALDAKLKELDANWVKYGKAYDKEVAALNKEVTTYEESTAGLTGTKAVETPTS